MITDTRQPIMFDTDAMPGKGAGTWQLHPDMTGIRPASGNDATDRVSKIARLAVGTFIGGGLMIAAINAFLL